MELTAKLFDELTTTELYEILRVRFEVFVIEQECIYLDIDGVDYQSLHVFCEENGKIIAYLRAFEKEKDVVQIGRVLTVNRGAGNGKKLLRYAVEEIDRRFHPGEIFIESQTHAIGFYEREGFKICSDEFLDAGIPHVQMILKRNVEKNG